MYLKNVCRAELNDLYKVIIILLVCISEIRLKHQCKHRVLFISVALKLLSPIQN